MTGTILVASLLAVGIVWAVVEWRTMTDDIPDNHITAVVRAAVKKQPGPFILMAFAVGYLAGHLFWP